MTTSTISRLALGTALIALLAGGALAAGKGDHGGMGGMGGRMGGAAMLAQLDTDGDGKISRAELEAHRAAEIARMDPDGDGRIGRAEFVEGHRAAAAERAAAAAGARFAALDANGDGVLSAAEVMRGGGPLAMFDRLDRNGDGMLGSEDAHDDDDRGGREHRAEGRHGHGRGWFGFGAPRGGGGD